VARDGLVTETDPARLPQFKGHPVPWAAKWSEESIPASLGVLQLPNGTPYVGYPDRNEDRDEHGYLWRREGIVRAGTPQFAQLNAYRQRAAMRLPRCQVCGVKLAKGAPIRWLLPPNGVIHSGDDPAALTHSPPTCDGCVPLARRLCPHLSAHGSMLVEVRDFKLWGLIGECFVLGRDELGRIAVTDRVKDLVVKYGRKYKGVGPENYCARQQVVELVDFEEIEEIEEIEA
jgi:hypothetical protein